MMMYGETFYGRHTAQLSLTQYSVYFKCIRGWHLLWSDIYGLTFQMSFPDIRGCNIMIAEGIDNWKVVALFVVRGHSTCHGSNVFGIRIDRFDNRNIMTL